MSCPSLSSLLCKAHQYILTAVAVPAGGSAAPAAVAAAILPQVKLPQRVPHGFHAQWVTAQQIKQQQLPGMMLQQAHQ